MRERYIFVAKAEQKERETFVERRIRQREKNLGTFRHKEGSIQSIWVEKL